MSISSSPFEGRKTLSALTDDTGGALVAPSGFAARRQKDLEEGVDPLASLADRFGQKDVGSYYTKAKAGIGAGHPPGVPFKGPSGLWFVVSPTTGRVVRSKAPGPGAASGGAGPAAATPPPSAGGAAATTPPPGGSPGATPGAGGKKPKAPKAPPAPKLPKAPTKAQLAKQAYQQALQAADAAIDDILKTPPGAGAIFNATQLQALSAHLDKLKLGDLKALRKKLDTAVKSPTVVKLNLASSIVNSILANAQSAGTIPPPTPPAPAPAPNAPKQTPAQKKAQTAVNNIIGHIGALNLAVTGQGISQANAVALLIGMKTKAAAESMFKALKLDQVMGINPSTRAPGALYATMVAYLTGMPQILGNFTGIDSLGRHWVNGRLVPASVATGAGATPTPTPTPTPTGSGTAPAPAPKPTSRYVREPAEVVKEASDKAKAAGLPHVAEAIDRVKDYLAGTLTGVKVTNKTKQDELYQALGGALTSQKEWEDFYKFVGLDNIVGIPINQLSNLGLTERKIITDFLSGTQIYGRFTGVDPLGRNWDNSNLVPSRAVVGVKPTALIDDAAKASEKAGRYVVAGILKFVGPKILSTYSGDSSDNVDELLRGMDKQFGALDPFTQKDLYQQMGLEATFGPFDSLSSRGMDGASAFAMFAAGRQNPGFTGVDALGRHWVNGKLVPVPDLARTPAGKALASKPLSYSSPDTDDRDEIDDVVMAAFEAVWERKTGSGKANYDDLSSMMAHKNDIWDMIKDAFVPGTDRDYTLGRALTSLHSQFASKVTAAPLYAKGGAVREPNRALPDEARANGNLNERDKAAIQSYTGTIYRLLNKDLRINNGEPTPRLKAIHNQLQAIMRKIPVFSKPVKLTRSMTLQDPAALSAFLTSCQAAMTNGATDHQFGGYLSTSTNQLPPGMGKPGGPNIQMNIKAVHGIDVKPFSHCPQANEVILDYNSKFKVTGVRQDPATGVWQVDVEQQPPDFSAPPKPGILGRILGIGGGGGARSAPKPTVPPALPPKPAKDFGDDPLESEAVINAVSGKKFHQYHTSSPGGGKEDTLLNEIMYESGRGNPPKVVKKAEIDNLKTQGWTVCYRAVKGSTEPNELSAEDLLSQFRSGELYNGAGIYGNGTYVAAAKHNGDESDAASHVKGYGPKSMRLAFPPTAKVARVSDIRREIKTRMDDIDQRQASGELGAKEAIRLKAVLKDPGRMAALLNYDVLEVDNEPNRYHVVLNRSILAVQEDDL